MGRFIYTIKDRNTGAILFVGGESSCAEYLDCAPTYIRDMSIRKTTRKHNTRFSHLEVTREYTEANVFCRDCGAKIPGANPNRLRCDACIRKRKRMLNAKYRTQEHPLSLEDDYLTIAEKQRVMQEACRGCAYFGGENYMNATCNYVFIVGHSRGCPPGEGCTQRKERKHV